MGNGGWSKSARWGAGWGLVAVLLTGCGKNTEPEPKPTPPDVSAALRAIDDPSLPLDEETGATLLDYVDDTDSVLEALGLEDRLLDSIYEALDVQPPSVGGAGGATSLHLRPAAMRRSAPVAAQEGAPLEGDGFLRITRVCEGWEEPVVDEGRNGSLSTIVGFTEAGLDPVVWTRASGCKYRASGQDVLVEQGSGSLDASVIMHLGGMLPPRDLGTEPILFAFNVVATFGEVRQQIQLVLRRDLITGLVELLLELPEGSLVLLVRDESLVGVRAADGEYSCDAVRETCTAADGSVIEL